LAKPEKKHLFVEGNDDLYAVAQLMGHHVQWGDKKPEWPVVIKAIGSVAEILEEEFISTTLTSSTVEILGIMIDADGEFHSRWNAIRRECIASFPLIPADLPQDGLVLENADKKRVGIWIMPDNTSKGMIETFLAYLVPNDQAGMWDRAKNIVKEVRAAGAPCRECHQDKANIHTWLAWQDPPGEVFGNAIVQKILDAKSPHAAQYVAWFKRLYQL